MDVYVTSQRSHSEKYPSLMYVFTVMWLLRNRVQQCTCISVLNTYVIAIRTARTCATEVGGFMYIFNFKVSIDNIELDLLYF